MTGDDAAALVASDVRRGRAGVIRAGDDMAGATTVRATTRSRRPAGVAGDAAEAAPRAATAAAAAPEADAALSPKHAKFREIGARRMGRALGAIGTIGNLANRNNYQFTEADVAKMTRTLHKAVDDLEAKFRPAERRPAPFAF